MFNFPSIGQLANLTPRQVADNWTNAARQAESFLADCQAHGDSRQAAPWLDRAESYHRFASDAWRSAGVAGGVAQADFHVRQANRLAKPTA